jgi:hypothetical protein
VKLIQEKGTPSRRGFNSNAHQCQEGQVWKNHCWWQLAQRNLSLM